jgi:hypothetical protein
MTCRHTIVNRRLPVLTAGQRLIRRYYTVSRLHQGQERRSLLPHFNHKQFDALFAYIP